MSLRLDFARLKQMAVALWKQGGLDTLVKVVPLGTIPNAAYPIGYCTSVKYILGRTPGEMEDVVGLARDSKLVSGADVYAVDPLPQPAQFELRGYSQCPAGIATDAPGFVAHPGYPPGLGAPQWEVAGCRQNAMRWIASVPAGQRFTYQVSLLPPRP